MREFTFQFAESLHILSKVLDIVRVFGDASFFQKAVELETPHSEELRGLVMREGARTKAFYHESLEGLAAWILVAARSSGSFTVISIGPT